MAKRRLALYTVNLKYIRNLSNVDDNVFSISPQVAKSTRPFLGILVICGNKQYCVPLSSPKEKHKNMKNDKDFMKMIDSHGELIGVLNFNNMIPVREDVISRVDMQIHPNDSAQTRHYKEMLKDQLTFCQQNQDIICSKAEKLYLLITKGQPSGLLRRRCCKFTRLEEVLERFTPGK